MRDDFKPEHDVTIRFVSDMSHSDLVSYLDNDGYELLTTVGMIEMAISEAIEFSKTLKHTVIAVAVFDTDYMIWGLGRK